MVPKIEMNWKLVCLTFLCLLVNAHHEQSNSNCKATELVIYQVKFETHWNKKSFPKQYPENRPPAHWSKLIGRSHNEDYVLFRIGETASEEFKLFAETGKTELFDRNNMKGVLDEFSTASIRTGSGKTHVNFFADGNHSQVSMAVKLIPSPDWFVGVDALNLCAGGTWLDSIVIEAGPLDAGTDSGFTFTAPNWATEPQEKITKITAQYPRHPANSFFYPKRRDLPVIATFHITKKKAYQLNKIIHLRRGQTAETQTKTEDKDTRSSTTQDDVGQQRNETAALSENHIKSKRLYKKRKFQKQHMKQSSFG